MQVLDVNVIGYCRVSTDEQAEEGYSIRAQSARILDYASSKGWIMSNDNLFIDEGYSGKDLNRPAIQRLLTYIESNEVDAVIVNRSDRLSRDLGDTVNLTKLLKRKGIMLISLTEDMKTDTATDRLKLNVTAVFNQYEREKRAEDVKMGMERAAKEGFRQGGPSPFGYDCVNQKLIINDREAAVVRDIFNWYLNNWGARTICNNLNRLGIPTKKGAKWSQRPVMYILQNPVYIGKIRWNYRKETGHRTNEEVVYESQHPPIISEQLFHQTQEMILKRKEMAPRQATHSHPFAGMIECTACGSRLHIKHGGPSWPHLHYKCPTKGCTRQIRHTEFVERFLEQIDWMTTEEFWEEKVENKTEGSSETELAKLKKELNGIESKKQKWLDAFENDVITMSVLKDRMKSIESREKELHEQISQLETKMRPRMTIPKAELMNQLRDFHSIWHEATDQEQKILVQTLFHKILYYPDRTIRIIPQ